jgi:hypothetical protein
MDTRMLIKARELFSVGWAPAHTQRHNMRAWVKSVRILGPKWRLAKPLSKQECTPSPF